MGASGPTWPTSRRDRLELVARSVPVIFRCDFVLDAITRSGSIVLASQRRCIVYLATTMR